MTSATSSPTTSSPPATSGPMSSPTTTSGASRRALRLWGSSPSPSASATADSDPVLVNDGVPLRRHRPAPVRRSTPGRPASRSTSTSRTPWWPPAASRRLPRRPRLGPDRLARPAQPADLADPALLRRGPARRPAASCWSTASTATCSSTSPRPTPRTGPTDQPPNPPELEGRNWRTARHCCPEIGQWAVARPGRRRRACRRGGRGRPRRGGARPGERPLPPVRDRSSAEYRVSSPVGTRALTTWRPGVPTAWSPTTLPRRLLRSPSTSPTRSPGTSTSTIDTGSSTTGAGLGDRVAERQPGRQLERQLGGVDACAPCRRAG